MDVALASIIASGVVALAAILAPIASSIIADSLKWQREARAKRKDKIETAAGKLLDSLAPWRSGHIEQAQRKSWRTSYSETLSAFYVWEHTIQAHCTKEQQIGIEGVRDKLETTRHEDALAALAMETADTVLSVSRQVMQKIDAPFWRR